MTFPFCFCLKRDRAAYSVSTTNVFYKKSKPIATTVTLAPLPVSSDMPVVSIESDYEKIIGSSGDGEICIINDHRGSTASMEYGGYAKLTPVRTQQPIFDDDSQLYATVNKTRTANNEIRTTPNTTATALRQGSSPTSTNVSSSSQTIFSPSSYLTGLTTTSPGPLPRPPLPPFPPQVFPNMTVNTIINNDDNNSSRRPHYDEVIARESLQHRAERLQLEEEQQAQQLPEDYYSSVNSEHGTTTGSDLYAEIANGSASGTVQQSHYYCPPSNGSGLGDDLSERYATVIDINNNGEQPPTNCIYQEVDSLQF